jgi:signal peptidase I
MRQTRLMRSLHHAPLMLAIGGFLAWYLVLGPSVIGGPATYVFVSGTSMEPTLSTGDLVITRGTGQYAVGDIVAFRLPEDSGATAGGPLVIHRIVGGSGRDGYIMRGDNRMGDDPWRPRAEDIAGSAWLVLPGVAPFVMALREPAVFGALAAGLTVFVILVGGGDRRRRPREAAPSTGR